MLFSGIFKRYFLFYGKYEAESADYYCKFADGADKKYIK